MNALLANRIKDDVSRVFVKAFGWAAVSFILICVIGVVTNIVVDQQGIIKDYLAKNKDQSFSANFYSGLGNNAKMLSYFSYGAMGLILVSSILRFIWWFRFQTAGKVFIMSTYTIYVIAQGLGFGLLFTLYQATDLLVVFGVAGGMFALMAFAGWHARNLEKLTVFLIYGSIGLFIMGIVAMILRFTGVYSSNLIFIYFLLGAVLTLFWIIWDVAALKRFAQANSIMGVTDEMAEFRLVTFFGFRFLSDLVNLIWTIARLMRYFKS